MAASRQRFHDRERPVLAGRRRSPVESCPVSPIDPIESVATGGFAVSEPRSARADCQMPASARQEKKMRGD